MNSVARSVQKHGVPRPGVLLEFLKPVTWFPPMWAFGCGAVSSGAELGSRWGTTLLGVVVAGPLVCASSQAVNDWFDRHVDALNEPDRPIPSGRLPGRWGLWVAIGWSALSAGAGWFLGPWGFRATLVALVLSWAYSAPPVRLKRNGWWGNLAVGISYEGLAWVTGAAVLLGGARPDAPILVVALLYSLGAHGIMTLNDFKSIEGDRSMGIGSIPVRLGPAAAARLASGVMLGAQAIVALFLAGSGKVIPAAVVILLSLGQLPLMLRLIRSPEPRAALRLSGFGVPLYVSGMMVAAFAIRGGGA